MPKTRPVAGQAGRATRKEKPLEETMAAFDVPDDQTAAETAEWSCIGRPAAAPRDRILIAATYLFCHQGFAATGVDAIVARAGAAKTTLYKHFESKEQLIDAVLEREGAAWRSWFFARLAQAPGGARDRMLAVFDALEEWFRDPQFYGCPFINAVGEFATGDERIRAAAAAHKSHLLRWLRDAALEMGSPAPDDVAREMVVLIDGAIVAAQNTRDPSFARVARGIAEKTLP